MMLFNNFMTLASFFIQNISHAALYLKKLTGILIWENIDLNVTNLCYELHCKTQSEISSKPAAGTRGNRQALFVLKLR